MTQSTRISAALFLIFVAVAWSIRASTGDSRKRQITFSFDSIETDSEGGVRCLYESPLILHVEYVIPTVLFIERVKGQIPTQLCEVHREQMVVRRLSIRHGLWGYTEEEADALEEYWEARNRNFPNTHRFRRLGCIVGSEKLAETYVCESCLEAREKWIAEHPDSETEPY